MDGSVEGDGPGGVGGNPDGHAGIAGGKALQDGSGVRPGIAGEHEHQAPARVMLRPHGGDQTLHAEGIRRSGIHGQDKLRTPANIEGAGEADELGAQTGGAGVAGQPGLVGVPLLPGEPGQFFLGLVPVNAVDLGHRPPK